MSGGLSLNPKPEIRSPNAESGVSPALFQNDDKPISDFGIIPHPLSALCARQMRSIPSRTPKLERGEPGKCRLAWIFHSHLGKSREKPYENRGANPFECVVETTRHAGLETCDTADWEVCATTLECRCVSRRMVARLQRLMAIMASKPRALPWAVMLRPFRPALCGVILDEESHGFSVDGTAQVLRYGRLGSLRYDFGMLACQRKNCCALSALDGNGGGKPRALPWAVMLRPFRPALCGVILDEESHGFSVDGTAQVLRYSRLGSLRYDVGMPLCQQKNGCALTALDSNYDIKTQGVALGCPVAAFQALDSHRHAGRRKPWI